MCRNQSLEICEGTLTASPVPTQESVQALMEGIRVCVEPRPFLGENNWIVPTLWLEPSIKPHSYRKGQTSFHHQRGSMESLDVLISEWKLCHMEQCMLLSTIRFLLQVSLQTELKIKEANLWNLSSWTCYFRLQFWWSQTRLANWILLVYAINLTKRKKITLLKEHGKLVTTPGHNQLDFDA